MLEAGQGRRREAPQEEGYEVGVKLALWREIRTHRNQGTLPLPVSVYRGTTRYSMCGHRAVKSCVQ